MDKSLNDTAPVSAGYHEHAKVPDYLMRHYWWAYVHPKSVRFWDRDWLINCILFGNYRRLGRSAIAEFSDRSVGKVLQLACVYGDLTPKLARKVAAGGGTLDVIDVLPIQLRNVRWKLPSRGHARLLRMDSTGLELPDATYDQVLLFFLLHEQPQVERAKTIREALRVMKRDGTLVIVDYGQPHWWNPMRYLLPPLLALLEPFALSLMRRPIAELLPADMRIRRESFFGGQYQKIVATRRR